MPVPASVFLIFLFGFDIFRATAMLMVLYSDLSIGEMLAVFGYLWFMMAPVQEILGIQYAFYAAKAALQRVNHLNTLNQEPHYPHQKNPFNNKKNCLNPYLKICIFAILRKQKY